ncbi:MAG: TIGR00266 family protein [Chloroflexi bacterium]|nr:MAG: TIGR00266 family protein [Chloroflexota bacterium]
MLESYTNAPGQRLDLPEPSVALTGTTLGGSPFKIVGSVMQALMIQINRGQALYSETGSLSWMTDGVHMDTNLGGKGLMGAISRVVTGESLFVVNYTADRDQQLVTFSSEFPGKIIPVHLAQGQAIIAQKDTMLVAEKSTNMSVVLQRRLGAGLFGGEGFILQRFEGPGTFFGALDGEIVEYTLAPGQRLLVDTGHVAMFEPTVTYDVQVVKGIKNLLFGGEGLFFVSLTGPGRIWLQTMPMSKLAGAIRQYLPKAEGSGEQGINIKLG